MHQPAHAGLARRLGDGPRAIDMHRLEGLLAAAGQNADGIDDDFRSGQRPLHRLGIAHVGLHRGHLPDKSCGLQEASKVGPAYGGAHAPALFRQRRDGVAADKSRAAENRRQSLVVEPIRHARILRASGPPLRPDQGRIIEAGSGLGRMRAAARAN